MSLESDQFKFGDFILDVKEKALLRDRKPLAITPKVFELLRVLVENHGHLVEKAYLMEKLWPDSFVEESNLTFSIRQLRKILGDEIRHPKFIETVPKRGYRFIADIDAVAANGFTQNDLPESAVRERSRPPVFLLLATVSLAVAAVSAGTFIWWGNAAGNDKLLVEPDSDLTFETLVSADRPMTAAISPDGKYAAYSRTANGLQSLWLRQLSSGVNTQIVAPEEGTKYYGIEFSANGEFIYFARSYKDEPAHIDRVSILGGNPKVGILCNIDAAFSISSDDRLISFRRYAPEKRSLLVANIDGSNERLLLETAKTFTDNVFSPDGKTISFASGQSDTGDRDFGVYTINVETGEVNAVTDFRWFHVRSIAWLPDQTGLLVTASSSAAGALNLWRISLPAGEVKKMIDSQAGFATISATRDMSQILLMQVVSSSNLYLAASTALDDLQPLAEAYGGLSWTPGGELVYSALSGGSTDIWKMDDDKITQKQLTTEDSLDFDPRVSPDGRYIVFTSDRAGRYNVWRMNADGSNPVALTNGDGEQEPVFTADGAFVIFCSMKNRSLWKVPIEGGEPTLISEKRSHRLSISPDGTKFAYFTKIDGKARIAIESFENGEILRQFDTPAGYFFGREIVWSDRDKALIYIAEDSNNIGNLWGQPLDDGSPERLTHYTSEEIFYFAFSHDRSETALIRGSWNYNAVLVKGFNNLTSDP